jgi:hypothetical protein
VLDGQLRRGYEVFDGLILGERERTQAEIDRTPGGAGGGDQANASGGSAGSGDQPQTFPGVGSQSNFPAGVPVASGSTPPSETYPPPEDIPSGRDDDVVARQLREAAMREPDPELREALWDEYRKYTGISEQ